MESNLGESFQKLMEYSFPRYKGKVVERIPSGFMVFSKHYTTWEKATKAIDEAGIDFSKSINRIK